MSMADRVVRWSTALDVLGVVLVRRRFPRWRDGRGGRRPARHREHRRRGEEPHLRAGNGAGRADRLHHRQPLARRIRRCATDAPQSAADIAASLTCPSAPDARSCRQSSSSTRRLPAAGRPSKAPGCAERRSGQTTRKAAVIRADSGRLAGRLRRAEQAARPIRGMSAPPGRRRSRIRQGDPARVGEPFAETHARRPGVGFRRATGSCRSGARDPGPDPAGHQVLVSLGQKRAGVFRALISRAWA